MPKPCPFCQRVLKDDARFCLGCGRQVGGEVPVEEAAALTDLKECFGAFPASKMECYLCADEAKCSAYTRAQQEAALLKSLGDVQGKLAEVGQELAAIRGAVQSGFEQTRRDLAEISSNLERSPWRR
jgi:hypothetical protein